MWVHFVCSAVTCILELPSRAICTPRSLYASDTGISSISHGIFVSLSAVDVCPIDFVCISATVPFLSGSQRKQENLHLVISSLPPMQCSRFSQRVMLCCKVFVNSGMLLLAVSIRLLVSST